MTIYYVLYVLVIAFGLLQYIKFKDNKKAKIIYLSFIGLFLVFIGGFRLGIGYDYRVYLVFYENAANISWSEIGLLKNEMGFNIFLKIISMFINDPQGLYVITTVILVGITFFIIYKYSKIPMISILLYLSTNAFISGMNLLRYTLAGIISFLAIYFLKKSKLEYKKGGFTLSLFFKDLLYNFLPYLLIILVSASFHRSALILIPIYYLVKIPFNYITMGIYGGFTVVYFIFYEKIIYYLSKMFYGGAYLGTEYVEPGGYQHATFHIIILILLIITHESLLKRDKSNLLYMNMYLYGALLYIMVAFRTYILSRLTFFFSLYLMLLLPEIISLFLPTKKEKEEIKAIDEKAKKHKLSKKEMSFVKKTKDYKLYQVVSLLCGIVLTIVIQYNAVTSSVYGAHGVFPYRSVFPIVNNINNLNFNNDREKKAKSLLSTSHENDPDISTYLTNVNDENYIVFISFNGSGTNYMHYGRYAEWEGERVLIKNTVTPYQNLGFQADFLHNGSMSFVGISDGGKVVLEKLSAEVIKEALVVDGISVAIESGGNLSQNPMSNIIINKKNYALGSEGISFGEGITIVVYDKILKRVVDSVFYTSDSFRTPPKRFN